MTRLLLVEDNEMNRDMLSRRLARHGFDVEIARNGLEGLAMGLGGRFDLILMDLSLPEIDGWEVTRRLKADPDARHTPIIALTAHAMAGDRERAIEAGCDDYEIKPIEFPRLLSRIDTILRGRAMSSILDLGHEPELKSESEPETDFSGCHSDQASTIRHDLITPVNHILGFTELLIGDAFGKGRFFRAQGLRSIREIGFQVLHVIDMSLTRGDCEGEVEELNMPDLAALRDALVAPSASIIEACRAIEETSAEVPDRETFLDDLEKIRQAAARLVDLIDQYAGSSAIAR